MSTASRIATMYNGQRRKRREIQKDDSVERGPMLNGMT
jgi:hypothetical protein